MFALNRCPWSLVVVTPVKYERDVSCLARKFTIQDAIFFKRFRHCLPNKRSPQHFSKECNPTQCIIWEARNSLAKLENLGKAAQRWKDILNPDCDTQPHWQAILKISLICFRYIANRCRLSQHPKEWKQMQIITTSKRMKANCLRLRWSIIYPTYPENFIYILLYAFNYDVANRPT